MCIRRKRKLDFEIHEDRRKALYERIANYKIVGVYYFIAESIAAYLIIYLTKLHLEVKNVSLAILVTILIIAVNVLNTRVKIRKEIKEERRLAE